jgi:hypothetical protein
VRDWDENSDRDAGNGWVLKVEAWVLGAMMLSGIAAVIAGILR